MKRLPTLQDYARPRTRGDCLDGGMNAVRPCPFVSCKHHLYIDVNANKPPRQQVKVNFPGIGGPEFMVESCALDVADRGETTLDIVGEKLNITRERARQIEANCMQKLQRAISGGNALQQLLPDEPAPEDDDPLPIEPLPVLVPEIAHAGRSRTEVRAAILAARLAAQSLILGTPVRAWGALADLVALERVFEVRRARALAAWWAASAAA